MSVPLQREIKETAKIWHIYMNIITTNAAPMGTITITITTTRPMSLTAIITNMKVMSTIITSTP